MAVIATKKTAARNVRPVDLSVFRGQTVMFNCRGLNVSWFHIEVTPGDDSLPVTRKLYTSPANWHVTPGSKYDISGQYNLIIRDVDARTDGGTYKCNTDESDTLLSADLIIFGNIV